MTASQTSKPEPIYVPVDQEADTPVLLPQFSEIEALTDDVPPAAEAQQFQEAPSIVYTSLTGTVFNEDGRIDGTYTFNLTVRALTGEEAIDKLVSAVNYAARKYGMTCLRPQAQPSPQKAAAAVNNTAAAPTAPARAAAAAVPARSVQQPAAPTRAPINAQAAAPAQQQPAQQESVFYAVKMKVVQREDKRIDLSWMIEGHSFPDITYCCTAEKAVELLADTGDWTVDYFMRPTTYDVQHAVIWKQGKQNSKGGFFKDIIRIEPF